MQHAGAKEYMRRVFFPTEGVEGYAIWQIRSSTQVKVLEDVEKHIFPTHS
jgi:hypothetical protein